MIYCRRNVIYDKSYDVVAGQVGCNIRSGIYRRYIIALSAISFHRYITRSTGTDIIEKTMS